MSSFNALLGGSGHPVACKVVNDDVFVHWWAADAEPDDPCLCGSAKRDRSRLDAAGSGSYSSARGVS